MRSFAHRRRHQLAPLLVLVAIIATVAWPPAFARETPPLLEPVPSGDPVRLTGRAEFLADPGGRLSVDELRAATGPAADFRPLTAQSLNQGVTTDAFWLRVRIPNARSEPFAWTLLAEAAYLDHLDAWVFDADGSAHTFDLSDRRAFSQRPVSHRALGFAHATPPGGYSDVYLRAMYDRLDTMHLGFRLVPAESFAASLARDYFGYGVLYGALFVLAAYALIIWRRARDPRFGYYAAYVLCTACTWMAVNGHLHQFVLPNAPELVNQGMHVIFLAKVITALLFSRCFLQTAQALPRTDRVLVAAVAVLAAGIGLRLLGLWTVPFVLAHLAIASLFLLAFVGIAAWRRGATYARWFVAAWLLYGGMLLLNALHVSGAVSWLHTDQIYPLAQTLNLIEIIMLAIAQSDRMRLLQGEQQAAEQRYRALLESHNEMLERRVGERTHELAAAWAQAREESETDEVTGLGNRRLFLRAGAEALIEPREGHQALVYFDLDGFKDINDHHGHAAGDAILRRFAGELADGVREGDLAARLGGDEFVLLLVNLRSVEEARRIVERICERFRGRATDHEGATIAHTVSAGIATRPPGAATSVRTLLARADLALYAAKGAGRDRAVLENSGREPADEKGTPAEPPRVAAESQ